MGSDPMPSRTLTILVAGLLVFSAAMPVALAQDDDEDDGDDADEVERKVEVETDEEGVSIELEREEGEAEDKVEMGFDYEEADFELGYETETENASAESKLEAQFGALAEYRDENDNGRYDAGEPLVSTWHLGEDADVDDDIPEDGTVQWQQATVSDVSRDGKQGKLINAPADLGDEGTFELTFLVFGDFVDLGTSSLTPTGAKIDIGIEDYPYQSNETELALFMETETEQEAEVDDEPDEAEDDETGVAASSQVGNRTVELVFTWKDSAQVDGTSEPVETTVLSSEAESETEDGETEQETKREFVLSYGRGDEIVHDPKAQVMVSSSVSNVPGLGAPLALLGLAGVALIARRRR